MVTFKKLGKLGRFGNQLFEYTGTKLYAHLNGFKSSFPKWIGDDIFRNIKPYSIKEKVILNFLPTKQLSDFQSYGRIDRIKYTLGIKKELPETINLKSLYNEPQDNINIYGYMQDNFSLKLLAEHKSLILEWLKFNEDIEENLNTLTNHFKPWIGIHIRRGDFVKRGLSVSTSLYKEQLSSMGDIKNIYLSTDDDNIKREFRSWNLIDIKNSIDIPDFIFDFWMLKNSEIILGSGSTFSWWAAYLGNKNNYYSPSLTHLWKPGYTPKLEKDEL